MKDENKASSNNEEEIKSYDDVKRDIDILKYFPHLAKEIRRKKEDNLSIESIRFDSNELSESDESELKNPDVISFLRRCDTDEQGIEIIDYMLNKKEISPDLAESLKIQLKANGIRSFGAKKEIGYYEWKYRNKQR
ncbi:MAG: DUF2095 family protein [Candidatus Helarchaeota archaeon]